MKKIKNFFNKKGNIGFTAVIVGAIICMFLAIIFPVIYNRVGVKLTNSTDRTLAVEGVMGSQILPPGSENFQGIKPGENFAGPGDSVIMTRKMFFRNKSPFVYAGEELLLPVFTEPENPTNAKINWEILNNKNGAGQEVGIIIKNAGDKAIKITGVNPGNIRIKATADDEDTVFAETNVMVYRLPSSIELSQNTVNVAVGQSGSVKATIKPADSSFKEIKWNFEEGTIGKECVNIVGTSDSTLKFKIVQPTGLNCSGKTVTMVATASSNGTKDLDGRNLGYVKAKLSINIR